jgi:ABC-2 type transport system permease protein
MPTVDGSQEIKRRLRRIFLNPLLIKDGLARMRSWRAPATIALYMAMLSLAAYLFVVLSFSGGRRGVSYAALGTGAFTTLAIVQLALVCLFTPGLAAGAVSGERERQTLDVLLVSGVSALSVIWGKLVASVAFILLLILAALPLFATVFVFGGIDLEQFAVAQMITASTAITIAAVSLLLSTVSGRTLVATVTAYGATFAGTVVTFVLGWTLTTFATINAPNSRGGQLPDPHPLLMVNPIQAIVTVLIAPNGTPESVGRMFQLLFLSSGPVASGGPTFQPWQVTMFAQVVIVVLSVAGAVWLLRGRRRFREAPVPAAEVAPAPELSTAGASNTTAG